MSKRIPWNGSFVGGVIGWVAASPNSLQPSAMHLINQTLLRQNPM